MKTLGKQLVMKINKKYTVVERNSTNTQMTIVTSMEEYQKYKKKLYVKHE